MDWADDVAYSVHDLEDAVVAGHFDLLSLRDPDERAELVALAARSYAGGLSAEQLEQAGERLVDLAAQPFDSSMRSLAALKGLTSRLIGRFSLAAEEATRAAFPGDRLTRYAADLVVPDDVRAEVAILKSVTARHVMYREGAASVYAEQRGLLAELVGALADAGRDALEPWLRPAYDAAQNDSERLRVVVDQVASLTDISAPAWHARWA
jgi:dGTPase